MFCTKFYVRVMAIASRKCASWEKNTYVCVAILSVYSRQVVTKK